MGILRTLSAGAIAAVALAGSSQATTITFDGIAAPASYVSYVNGPLTLSGVTFTSNGDMFVINSGYYGDSYPDGGYLTSDYAATDILTATLPAGVTEIGFDYGGLFGPVTFTVALSNGATYTPSTSDSISGTDSLQWVEFSSATPITSVVITMPDYPNYNAIDNFSFGTPEPGTWAPMLVGIGLAGASLRRRVRPSVA